MYVKGDGGTGERNCMPFARVKKCFVLFLSEKQRHTCVVVKIKQANSLPRNKNHCPSGLQLSAPHNHIIIIIL